MILGGGVTGLAAGIATGEPVYEASDRPGGICSSYWINGYRFERGGGHWIFGDASLVEPFAALKRYQRKASVFFPSTGRKVAYPIQAHLDELSPGNAARAQIEMHNALASFRGAETMREYMRAVFGPTLCALFFDPFNELYTAGLYGKIAVQDGFKSPVADGLVAPKGYNQTFAYPVDGLDGMCKAMASRCDIRYGKRVAQIDSSPQGGFVFFEGDTGRWSNERIISTLPLHETLRLANIDCGKPDPHTSVAVLNIGATRGPLCPDDHWLYVPESRSGFHRVGFYSNVDPSFAPKGKVSIYVETAFLPGSPPATSKMAEIIGELRQWGFIGGVEAVHLDVIDCAYTWRWPGSMWRERAIKALADVGIEQRGRYARWHFQGIAESIAEGLACAEAATVETAAE